MRKSLILLSVLGLLAPAEAGRADVIENPRNIQIRVEMRQAAFQNQGGTQTTSQSSSTQFIVVSEGLEGRIFLGEKVPYAAYYQNYLTREGYLTAAVGYQLQDVGTSLIVRARVAGGGLIEVTLTPEISYLTGDGRGSIAVQKMSTTVIVRPDQPMEIGGNISQSEFDGTFYRGASGQSLQIVLIPSIMGG